MSEEEKLEGFWYSEFEPEFPFPEEHKSDWVTIDFLFKLICLESKLLDEYKKIVTIANNGGIYKPTHCESYRGSSSCRICKCQNGSREFTYGGFCWPEGFRHYIECHKIKPSDEFIEMILGFDVD